MYYIAINLLPDVLKRCALGCPFDGFNVCAKIRMPFKRVGSFPLVPYPARVQLEATVDTCK